MRLVNCGRRLKMQGCTVFMKSAIFVQPIPDQNVAVHFKVVETVFSKRMYKLKLTVAAAHMKWRTQAVLPNDAPSLMIYLCIDTLKIYKFIPHTK